MTASVEYPEIHAYNAAKKALEDFDRAHERMKSGIESLADILRRGGWAAVRIDGDDSNSPERQMPDDTAPIGTSFALASLSGESVFRIVTQRRQLAADLRRAYQAIPEQIRPAVQAPGGSVATQRPRQRRK